MANTKSAKKATIKAQKAQAINNARKTGVKTAIKKVVVALQDGKTAQEVQQLFNDAQAKCARAKGKGLFHQNTAARKVSRLAIKIQKHFAQPEATVAASPKASTRKVSKK